MIPAAHLYARRELFPISSSMRALARGAFRFQAIATVERLTGSPG
jgi:hypothetical protein